MNRESTKDDLGAPEQLHCSKQEIERYPMISLCPELETLDISSFDISKVTDLR